MNDWTFIQHPDATWSWLDVERDHVSGSFRHFRSLDEAVRDAAEHGYERGVSTPMHVQRERRARPRIGVRHHAY